MSVNRDSVLGFLLRQGQYAEQDIAKILGYVSQASGYSDAIQTVINQVQTDESTLAAGGSVPVNVTLPATVQVNGVSKPVLLTGNLHT